MLCSSVKGNQFFGETTACIIRVELHSEDGGSTFHSCWYYLFNFSQCHIADKTSDLKNSFTLKFIMRMIMI